MYGASGKARPKSFNCKTCALAGDRQPSTHRNTALLYNTKARPAVALAVKWGAMNKVPNGTYTQLCRGSQWKSTALHEKSGPGGGEPKGWGQGRWQRAAQAIWTSSGHQTSQRRKHKRWKCQEITNHALSYTPTSPAMNCDPEAWSQTPYILHQFRTN